MTLVIPTCDIPLVQWYVSSSSGTSAEKLNRTFLWQDLDFLCFGWAHFFNTLSSRFVFWYSFSKCILLMMKKKKESVLIICNEQPGWCSVYWNSNIFSLPEREFICAMPKNFVLKRSLQTHYLKKGNKRISVWHCLRGVLVWVPLKGSWKKGLGCRNFIWELISGSTK